MKVVKHENEHYFKLPFLRNFGASYQAHKKQLQEESRIANIKYEKERQIMLCHKRLRKIQWTYNYFKHENLCDRQILINAGYSPKEEYERGYENEQLRLKYIKKHNLQAQYPRYK